MLGKTHVNLGFLTAMIFKINIAALPTAMLAIVFNLCSTTFKGLILAFITVCCVIFPTKVSPFLVPLSVLIGSLVLDLDEPNSTLSRLIMPTEFAVKILLVSAGIFVIIAGGITNVFSLAAGILLIAMAIINLPIPFFSIHKLQKIFLVILGIGLIFWAKNNYVLAAGILFLLMGVLSHRGLTHSLEGIILFSLGAWWFLKITNHSDLLWPFVIGMISHAYVGDLLSNHGTYLSYIAKIKISVPIFNTGSTAEKGLGYVALGLVLLICFNQLIHLNSYFF